MCSTITLRSRQTYFTTFRHTDLCKQKLHKYHHLLVSIHLCYSVAYCTLWDECEAAMGWPGNLTGSTSNTIYSTRFLELQRLTKGCRQNALWDISATAEDQQLLKNHAVKQDAMLLLFRLCGSISWTVVATLTHTSTGLPQIIPIKTCSLHNVAVLNYY